MDSVAKLLEAAATSNSQVLGVVRDVLALAARHIAQWPT